MYDCLKKEMKSKLVFQFIKNIQWPQYIEILKFKKEISPNADEIEIDFVDSSINDYKVYLETNSKYKTEFINGVTYYDCLGQLMEAYPKLTYNDVLDWYDYWKEMIKCSL